MTMKTRGTFALAVGMTLLLAACTSTSEPVSPPALPLGPPLGPLLGPEIASPLDLVGVWVLEDKEAGGIQVFARAPSLTGNHLGYEFSEHGGLMVHKPGWCGTPPITWMNHEGLWSLADERLLDIRHAWRGRPQEYQLEIISLDQRRLVCRVRTDPGS